MFIKELRKGDEILGNKYLTKCDIESTRFVNWPLLQSVKLRVYSFTNNIFKSIRQSYDKTDKIMFKMSKTFMQLSNSLRTNCCR